MVATERGLQLGASAVTGQLGLLAAQRLDLRGPVQAQNPAKVCWAQPGRAFGAGFAQQRQEHAHQQRHAQP